MSNKVSSFLELQSYCFYNKLQIINYELCNHLNIGSKPYDRSKRSDG